MAILTLSSLILYATISVIVGSIVYTGFKVLRLKKPKRVSPEIKKWKKDTS
jgi:hypothetical protein